MPLRLHPLPALAAALVVFGTVAGAAPEPAGAFYGSGFFVTGTGTLLTAAHVVQRCRRLAIETASGQALDAQAVRTDVALDVAILQVRSQRPLPVLALRRDPTPMLGEAVATYGFPFLDALQGRATFETGIVTGTSGLNGDPTEFRVSIPLDGGFSGAPIVDRSGLVIGLARGFAAHGRPGEAMQQANINLAVSGPKLGDLLRTGATRTVSPATTIREVAPATTTRNAATATQAAAVLTTTQLADLLARATVLVRCLG